MLASYLVYSFSSQDMSGECDIYHNRFNYPGSIWCL